MYFGYGAGCQRDPGLCGVQWWFVCWRRCPQGYRPALWLLPHSMRRAGGRGEWENLRHSPNLPRQPFTAGASGGGSLGCHPMEGQPNLFPYGCWGHWDITGSTARGQMAPGTGQMAPSQTGSRGAGGLWPWAVPWGVPQPAGGGGPRGTGTTSYRRPGGHQSGEGMDTGLRTRRSSWRSRSGWERRYWSEESDTGWAGKGHICSERATRLGMRYRGEVTPVGAGGDTGPGGRGRGRCRRRSCPAPASPERPQCRGLGTPPLPPASAGHSPHPPAGGPAWGRGHNGPGVLAPARRCRTRRQEPGL